MLTQEMENAISLLKEISYMEDYVIGRSPFPHLSDGNVRELLCHLCRNSLLRVVDPSLKTRESFNYALSRPLQEITLYDILRATGGNLHLSVDSSEDASERYGLSGRRISVLETMIRHLLSDIPIVEVVFPGENEKDGLKKEPVR